MIFVLTEVQEVKQGGRKKHLMAKHFTGPDFPCHLFSQAAFGDYCGAVDGMAGGGSYQLMYLISRNYKFQDI